jgi:hypothetical protein
MSVRQRLSAWRNPARDSTTRADGADGHHAGATGQPVRLPWWITTLDVLTLVLTAVMLRVALLSPIRVKIGDARMIAGSWTRVLLMAVACAVVRHALIRERPLPSRIRDWVAAIRGSASFQAVWPAFITSRVATILAGYFAVLSIGFDKAWTQWRISSVELYNLPARWDSGHYLEILNRGYTWDGDPTHQSVIAFFPGFPILMRAMSTVLVCADGLGGFIVVGLAFFFGLIYLYRLALEYLEPDQAKAVVALAAFYPFGVFYSALYTESVFLLAGVATFYHFRRHEYARAALFGLLAGLTRPNGFLLSVPLGLLVLEEIWSDWQQSRRAGRSELMGHVGRKFVPLLTAAVPVMGMLLYSGYIYTLTGDPFTWAKLQEAWRRHAGALGTMVTVRFSEIKASGLLAYIEANPAEILDGAAVVLALVAIGPVVRRFGAAYGVFIALSVIPPLLTAGTISLGRYTAPLFPIYLWLGGSIPPQRRAYWFAAFAAGQALVAALFFTWRPPF